MSAEGERQADRIEALLTTVNAKLDVWLASQVGEVRQQPLDPSVLPDFYRDLWSLPNFKKTLEECQQWLVEKNIGEEKASQTAAYIRGVWPGPKRSWKQPWAVFRNLVTRTIPGPERPPKQVRAAPGDEYRADFERRRGSQ